MNWLIYGLPAIGWGLMSVISKKAGGTPSEQMLGTTTAAFLTAVLLHFMLHVQYTGKGILASLISGTFWAGGQYLQFKALKKGEVSKVMPLSNGSQLVMTTVVAGILLQEWHSKQQSIVTLCLLIVILVAMFLITKTKQTAQQQGKLSRQTLFYIGGSSICLVGYVMTTGFFNVSGSQIFLPQATAMLLSAVLISLSERQVVDARAITRNLPIGVSWAIANMAIFYTATHLGVGLSYTISQLCTFVSVLGGIVLLKERRSRKEYGTMSLGLLLFFAAIIGLSQFK